MSRFFIKMENGSPIGFPIAEDNLKIINSSFDPNNLGDKYRLIQKTSLTIIPNPYEAIENSYEVSGEFVVEKYVARQMSPSEIIETQERVKNNWIANNNPKSWIFNESICRFESPVKYPDDGKKYIWDEASISWKEVA